MNILLVGINAKFIHSNLAIRSIKNYAEANYSIKINIAEYTINHHLDYILQEIFLQSPDVLGISCYIWNWELIKMLVPEIKKMLPNLKVILGGPEVSFNSDSALTQSQADFVLLGEGEKSFSELVNSLIHSDDSYKLINGITYYDNGEIISNQSLSPMDMDKLPFVYNDLSEFENRIIYYESMRGCPFNCQYCLSSTNKGVRFRNLELVLSELDHFLENRVRQVKFVDRTFNCNKEYSQNILKHLIDNDNGYTNFHFEIAADLLDDSTIELVSNARKGLFQFEIGVQSTNPKTLSAIDRKSDFEYLSSVVKKLQKPNNIHLHLDLIAGLPYEDITSFKKSFNDVYSLSPDQFQLGFLKLLKGSGLHQKSDEYGIVCRNFAPYEVLYTKWVSPQEMQKLKQIENVVEIYYNSNRFLRSIKHIEKQFETPFELYSTLADFYYQNGFHSRSHSKLDVYNILYEFYLSLNPVDTTEFLWLIKFDLYSHEKAKKLPEWMTNNITTPYRQKIIEFLDDRNNIETLLSEYSEIDSKTIGRMVHIEIFPFNPITLEKTTTTILFNYKNCDILGNASYYYINL